MEQKVLALQLGLPETATEAEITARIGELKAAKEENVELVKEKEALTLATITNLVAQAVADKRLTEDYRQQFIELGKKVGVEDLEKTLKAMSPQVKISTMLGHQGGTPTAGKHEIFSKLSEVPPVMLAELREKNLDEYKRLYRAEYGYDCEL